MSSHTCTWCGFCVLESVSMSSDRFIRVVWTRLGSQLVMFPLLFPSFNKWSIWFVVVSSKPKNSSVFLVKSSWGVSNGYYGARFE